MKNYLTLAIVAIAIVGTLFYLLNINNDPTSLNAPLVKNLNEKYGSNIQLTGTAYPNAKVLVYVNDKYIDDMIVDENGTFSKTISFDSEGIKKIKVKQAYKNIESEFGSEYPVEIDTTAPDKALFSLITELPQNSKEKSILIKGTGSPNEFIVLDNNKHKVAGDGAFEINYSLQEGDNNLEFSMADEIGNRTGALSKHVILVDTIPPTISNFIAPISRKPTEESIVIDIGNWQGYLDSVNSVAITGSVDGKIKSITVDGKSVSWDENNKIYQRMNLFIYGGLNKYKVVAEDMAGNISTGFVQTTAERDNDELNVNLNEY